MGLRNLSGAIKTAIRSGNCRPCYLIAIDYPAGTVRATDYAHDIEIDGVTYYSPNGYRRIDVIGENAELEVDGASIEFASNAPGFVAAMLLYNHINLRARVSYAWVNADNGNLIGSVVILDGLTSFASILDADPTGDSPQTKTALLQVRSQLGSIKQRAGRRTNKESQKEWFSGDRGLDFVPTITDDLIWGRPDRL